jgi:Na+/proline symporter
MQFAVAMIGCIALAVLAVQHVGGMAGLKEGIQRAFGDSEAALAYLPFGNQVAWMPLHAFLVILLVQWWATWYPGAEPGGGGYVAQRMAACRNERHAVAATLWYQIAHYSLRPWPWIIAALAALVLYPQLRTDWLADPSSRPDVGYPMLIRDVAPPGMRGLMLVTFFAAFMSTISTQMNWGASYLVRDLYERFMVRGASPRHYARVGRVASLIVLLMGGVAAWGMRGISIDAIWRILLALGAGTGAVFMLRWFWWRINAWTEISAMCASLAAFLLIGVGQPQKAWELATVPTDEAKTLAVALVSIAVWLAVTFLTRPESEQVLAQFFRRIHPAGPGWGPIRKRVPEVAPDRGLGWSVAAALAAATLVYSILPLVGALVFGRPGVAATCGAVAVVSAGAVVFCASRIAPSRSA